MKKLKNYLPFHFLTSLILGIVYQHFIASWCFNIYTTISLSLICIVVLLLFKKSRIKYTITSWIVFFFIGICITYFKDPKNQQNYFNAEITNGTLKISVYKVLKPSKNYYKYFASVDFVGDKQTSGNILMYLKKDNLTFNNIAIGDEFLIKNQIQTIPSPKNPHQFNYKAYLANKYVYHQTYLSRENYIRLKKNKQSLIGWVSQFKTHIKKRISNLDFSFNELAIINALLLGDKNDINSELKNNYSKAGAIHILAISGLHIGILLLLFSKLLSPIETIKGGTQIKAILLVIILWGFAILTGLSASVVRATTMFSFLTIGNLIQKTKVIEFSLISSMLLLLLVKPLFLFDVGFQLSYLAVFGIIWIQPKLQNLLKCKNYFIYKVWQLITVSISAQLAILPLSIYYFHQFPGLFIISNLVIIPALGVILFLGFLIIVLSLFNNTPDVLVFYYGQVIRLMNFIMEWIANKETFIFNKLHFSFLEMFICYLILIITYRAIVYKKQKMFLYSLASIIVIQSVFIVEKNNRLQKEEYIVFHQYKNSLIAIRKGQELFTDTTKVITEFNPLLSYEINERTSIKHYGTSKNIYQFKNKTILKIDSTAIYNIEGIEKPIIVLANNPKINLSRVIKKLKPQQIIADGSNYNSNCELWKQTCKQQKTPFHQTRQNGAYILK